MIKNIFKQIVVSVLIWEAKKTLKAYSPKIVAITGSVGKTSTKDAIAHVLRSKYAVRESTKSFNSEIGLPLTVLGLPNAWGSAFGWILNIIKGWFVSLGRSKYPEWLVLEVGADHPGDIQRVSKWLRADIVIITKLPRIPVHVEFFASPAEVSREKLFLLDALKQDGVAIINYEDSLALSRARAMSLNVMTVGTDIGADFRASNYNMIYRGGTPEGINFKIDHKNRSFPADVRGALGRGLVLSSLFAVSAGVHLGMNMIDLIRLISALKPPKGRMNIIPGLKDTLIIDDTYNSSPVAAENALETFKVLEVSGRKIAVLGDMAELGEFSEPEHKKVGAITAGFADILVTVGRKARMIAEGALNEGLSEKNILQFDDPRKAGKHLELSIKAGDAILVKGSQSVRMERVVEEIMDHPENKKDLLVRQDEEWQKR